jgi:hypothetical protein
MATKRSLDERCAELRARMIAERKSAARKRRQQAIEARTTGIQLPPGHWTAWHVGDDLKTTHGAAILLIRDDAAKQARAEDHAHLILCACGGANAWTAENWNVQKTDVRVSRVRCARRGAPA